MINAKSTLVVYGIHRQVNIRILFSPAPSNIVYKGNIDRLTWNRLCNLERGSSPEKSVENPSN